MEIKTAIEIKDKNIKRRRQGQGISLIELLLYMALLGVLMVTTFSMAFILGRDRENLANGTERQLYGISFLEFTRNQLQNAASISEPQLNASSAAISFDGQTLHPSETNGNKAYVFADQAASHTFIFVPNNIIFSRAASSSAAINGSFSLRKNIDRPFQFLMNTWPPL